MQLIRAPYFACPMGFLSSRLTVQKLIWSIVLVHHVGEVGYISFETLRNTCKYVGPFHFLGIEVGGFEYRAPEVPRTNCGSVNQ